MRFVQLSDVCDLQNGHAFKSKDYVEKSNTCNIRMSNIRPGGNFDEFHNERYLPDSYTKKFKEYLLNDGDLIIAMTDMATETKILGLPTLVNNTSGRSFLLNQRVGKLCKFSKDIYVPYLRHILTAQDVIDYYKSLGAGGLQINISKKDILSVKFPLPSLSTQQKIVAKLDTIFTEIDKAKEKAEANIKNAELLFISYLNKILNYKNGWKNSKLKDICIFINRGISPSYTNQGGTLILNQKCIRNHKVAYDLGRRHDENKKEIKKERLLIQGDVLVNSTGVGTLGRVGQVIDIIKEKITVDSHITILRPNTELLYYKFFGYIMISIEDEIKNSGEGTSGQTELSRIKLSEKFIIKYPEDKNLQKLIVSKLDLIKENSISIKKIMDKKIIELNLLKNSILRQAFNGELVKAA